MDYDKIVSSMYDWFSLQKLIWFLVFFWLSLPVLIVVPEAVIDGFFASGISWVVFGIYAITYFAVIIGFLTLTCACLKEKNLQSKELTPRDLIETIFLVFVELFYVFVWNMNKKYRVTQLLLLAGIPLLALYRMFSSSLIIETSFLIFLTLYILMIIYNLIRVFFSVMVFYNSDLTAVDAVKKSWGITSKKTGQIITGLLLIFGIVLIIFLFITILLAAISNLVLLQYFIPPLAFKLAFLIGMLFAFGPAILSYYFAITELYYQIITEHDSSHRIKRILMRRVLTPKNKKSSKKKSVLKKRKVSSKKSVKKKTVKKKFKKRSVKKVPRKKSKKKK